MNNLNIDLGSATDDDFFGSLKEMKSAKLQELFVEDSLSFDDKQQSLKYNRPRDIATSSSVTSVTLLAKVATTYKQGELVGKVGLALIQNPDDTCNIIIYKTKCNILASLKLQPDKELLYKQTKYWQFYDDISTYWSFGFDTPADEKEFIDILCSKKIPFKKNENKQNAEQLLGLYNFSKEAQHTETDTIETKYSLINRMAKMGKPLPTLLSSNQHPNSECDSSDTEVVETPLVSSQKPSIATRSNKLISNKTNQQLVASIAGLNSVASGSYPINQLESQYMQMLLTEQRTQGSELRMNMNKLENKIERVLDKLELYDRKDNKQKIEKDDEILELEEKLLIVKKENKKLKQTLLENSTNDSEEYKIRNVLYVFKEDLKHFNIDYNQDLEMVLTELNGKLKESRNKLHDMEQKINDNELKLNNAVTELEFNTRKNIELTNEISALNFCADELKQQLNEKETEILKQKHSLLEFQLKLEVKNEETLKTNDALVKSIMNNLYMDIADKLHNANLSQSEQILSLIASSIKQQTLKSLQQSKQEDVLK